MVTIIMPAYNCEKYLTAAVESVIKQSFVDWRLLILDDCSTDGTRALAERLAESDARITALHNERNMGVSRTRNRGVQESDTDWIAFLDSDDMWAPDKLQKQFSVVASHPEAKLLFTGSAFIRESGERYDYVLHVPEQIDRKELLKQNIVSCSSVLVKRDLLLRYPMPDKRMMHEDYTVWLRILAEEPYAYAVNEPLLIYRKYQASKSGNKIKAARMNWNAYREVGLNPIAAIYYMCWYAVRGIRKYSHLQ